MLLIVSNQLQATLTEKSEHHFIHRSLTNCSWTIISPVQVVRVIGGGQADAGGKQSQNWNWKVGTLLLAWVNTVQMGEDRVS